MTKIAILFPGQGSQHVGMAASFMTHPTTQDLFTQANDALGFDLAALMSSGAEETLRQTENTQPALLLAGIAAWTYHQTQDTFTQPTLFAGHSLGEYTALVAAGVMSFTDGLKLVRQRGEFMAAAVPKGQGGMSAVLGLPTAKIEPIAKQYGVYVANDNADGQVILSGEAQKLTAATDDLKTAGAKRVLPLPVAGPFHTPLMQSAADKMADTLENIEFRTPSAPIILNTTAESTTDAAFIKQNLPQQITSPVRWRETMTAMKNENITHTLELGAGSVLTNLAKRAGHSFDATALQATA